MSRFPLGDVAFEQVAQASGGVLLKPGVGKTVTVRDLAGGVLPVWSAESGGSSSTSATSDSEGDLNGWVAAPDFDIVYSDGTRKQVRSTPPGKAHVNSYGAVADNTADNTAAFTGAIAALPSSGGELLFGDGIYRGRVVVPQNKLVVLKGCGMDSTGGAYGTIVKRPLGSTSPVLDASAGTTAARCYLEVWDLRFDGDSANGDVVYLKDTTDVSFNRVRIKLGAQKGLHCEDLFNASFHQVYISNCGSGTTHPALMLDASSDGTGTNTVHFSDCELEGNTGTDVLLTGDQPGSKPTVAVNFSNLKIERSNAGQSYPIFDVDYARDITVQGFYFYLGHGTSRHLEQDFAAGGGTPLVKFSNGIFRTGGSWAGDVFVNHDRGSLGLSNVEFAGAPSSVFWNVTANVALDGAQAKNLHFSDNTKRFLDARTDGLLGKEVRTVHRWHFSSGAATAELATSSLGSVALRDAQQDIISGIVRAPANALPGRNPTIRAVVSSTATGVARLVASSQVRAVGDASNTGATTSTTDLNVSAANTLFEFTGTPAVSVQPGRLVQCRLFRDGIHANDTLAADLSVVEIDVLFEVAV